MKVFRVHRRGQDEDFEFIADVFSQGSTGLSTGPDNELEAGESRQAQGYGSGSGVGA